MSSDGPTNTLNAIMKFGRALVQAHGYNALSFREIAKEVGVKSASVHYHFPTKGDLAAALAKEYTDQAVSFFQSLEASESDHDRMIDAYISVYRAALEQDNRMCLCGMMAAESADLPAFVLTEVNRFGEVNARWLTKMLSKRHPKTSHEKLEAQALSIYAAIEGAQLVARGRGDVAVFDRIIAAYKALGLFS